MLEVSKIVRRRVWSYNFIFLNHSLSGCLLTPNALLNISNFVDFCVLFPRSWFCWVLFSCYVLYIWVVPLVLIMNLLYFKKKKKKITKLFKFYG
jgi:hypothetical protein